MSSTDLITYLNYISTWDTESDANITPLISEHNQFVNLGDFDSDSAVDSEFDTLIGLAREVRDLTIEADTVQIAADAAAVSSIWSFGLGMAVFAMLEAGALCERGVISSKSTALNNKLTSVDADISAKIGDSVKSYVAIYKSNNELIASKAPKGMDTRTCRSNLLQFIADVQRHTTLTPDNFRKYAGSARRLYNSDEINKVYDALDELNLSGQKNADVAKFMNVLAGLGYPSSELMLVQGVCLKIMVNKLGVAQEVIEAQAKAANIPLNEVEASAFGTMSAAAKFFAAVAIIMSVVDAIFQVLDIIDVVEQCSKMCDELNGTIRQNYKNYFDGIKKAAAQYNAAIAGAPGDAARQAA